MGADTFITLMVGKYANAKEAFYKAGAEAAWMHGHSGYTGTIAEKNDFIMIKCPEKTRVTKLISDLIENDDKRIEDKWGPAGCVEVTSPSKMKELREQRGLKGKKGIKAFYFFGWASC